MPADWISISAVTRDPSTTFDSVDPDFSGVYCSSQCAVVARSIASTLAAKSIRPPELNIRDEVVETREMQATRIGLTVLDILDALFSQQLGAGAIIPLSAEYDRSFRCRRVLMRIRRHRLNSKSDLYQRARMSEAYLEITRRQLDDSIDRLKAERVQTDEYLYELTTVCDQLMRLTAENDNLNAVINDLREQLTAAKRTAISLEKKQQKTPSQEKT